MATVSKPAGNATELPWPTNNTDHDTSKGVPQRVAQHQTSTNPSAPAQIRVAPRLHGRITHANTPALPTTTLTPTIPLPPPINTPEINTPVPQQPRRSKRIALLSPCLYSNMAVHQISSKNHDASPSYTPQLANPSQNTNAYKKTHSYATFGPGRSEKNSETLHKAITPLTHQAPTPYSCSHTNK